MNGKKRKIDHVEMRGRTNFSTITQAITTIEETP